MHRIPELKASIDVFAAACVKARSVFFLLFSVFAQAAILMLLLFNERYEASQNLGSSAKDFLNTFIAMFVVSFLLLLCGYLAIVLCAVRDKW